MFTRFASYMVHRSRRTRQGTSPRKPNRARISLEPLEGRLSPSYLTFGTAYAAGAVAVGNLSTSASSYYLPYGSASGNLAIRNTSSVGQSYSYLNYANNYSDTLRLSLQSSLNTGNQTSGTVRTNLTTANNGGPYFVTLNVKGGSGDFYGRKVLVTISATYLSTISGKATNFTQISYSNSTGQHDIFLGTTNIQGTRSYNSGTYSFYTTVGSSFSLCVTTIASGYGTNAVANGTASITITTRSV